MKKLVFLFLCLCLTLSCAAALAGGAFIPGTYEATAQGFGGDVKVTLTMDENAIISIEILADNETPGIGQAAIPILGEAFVGRSDANVDGVSGATFTSNALKEAVKEALASARPASIPSSSLYTYSIKGNGTAVITKFDWSSSAGDIYIPSMLDGYYVTGIGDEAFYVEEVDSTSSGCTVRLPDTITSIGERAFMNSNVVMINIPSSVQYIGKGAFAACPITQFILEGKNSNYAVLDGALYEKKTKTLIAYPIMASEAPVIPEGIQAIGDYAIYSKGRGTTFNLSDLPSTVTAIGDYAFTGVQYLLCYTDFVTLKNVERIGEYAFSGACFEGVSKDRRSESKKTVTIALRDVQPNAFRSAYFKYYSNFKFLGDQAALGDYAFYAVSTGGGFNSSTSLSFYGIASAGKYALSAIKGRLFFSFSKLTFADDHAFSKNTWADAYFISPVNAWPGSASVIPDGCFEQNSWMREMQIQEGVTQIGENAFRKSESLETVTLPETLERIGSGAFSECPCIKEITIPANVSYIGSDVFDKTKIMLYVASDSYAALWASENGYNYQYTDAEEDDLDWLNN